MSESIGPDRVRVDAFVLADAAQECAGKLNIIGGGWNMLFPKGPDTPVPTLAVAVRVLVPWTETNRPLHFDINVHNPDGEVLNDPALSIELNVGRPVALPAGTEQAAPFALTLLNVQFEREGAHAFVMTHEEREVARSSFLVQFRP